jgi:filamentous hemagglutinin family protein
MNKLTKSGLILLGLHYLIFAHPKVVKSQIIPDGTLPNNSAVSTNDKITEISGGTTARNNLFHSFSEFSVPTGNIVFFNNPLTVENIFSRVTGSSVSNIDGILRANGTANLFLINPKGILFGPNATLDLGGSFFASTADRIIFADGTEFSATAPANSSLLTVSVPVGLGFGKNGGAIRVSGKGYETSLPAPATDTRNNIIARTLFPFARTRTSPTGLEVKPEKTLALVGGDIFLEGGILSAKDGSVALGSVRSGRIGLDYNAETWTLDYENVSNFGDIKLSDRSLVEVSGRPQSIEIWGNNLSLTEGSLVVIQNQSQGSIGNLTVNASNSLSIVGTSGAQAQESRSSLVSESIGLGDGGNIQISAKQLRIEEGGGIRSAGLNRGRGGNINLTAENILLRETTPFGSFSGIATITAGFGEGGKVNVSARTLAIADGAALGSSTYGAANGGNVTVNVSERVEITGISRIPIRNTTVLGSAPTLNANLASLTFGSGRGGNLVLSTPLLFLNQEGIITSSTVGSGRAGDIAIAADLIEIDGTSKSLNNSYISNSTIGTGNAGNLSIDATNLIIRDGGGVSTSTTAAGNSGLSRVCF